MDLVISDPPEQAPPSDPLAIAAEGLAVELLGDRDRGREVYRRLIDYRSTEDATLSDEDTVLAHLLGHALLAWSGPKDLAGVIDGALQELEPVRDGLLAGVYLMKLANFATDQGQTDRAIELLDASHRRMPKSRTLLRWRVDNLKTNLSRRGTILFRPDGSDPLADPVWLLHGALDAAQSDLTQRATALVTNPWTRGWTFGQTAVDRTQAAVNQAEWAGAMWLLPSLRRQLGAQILSAGGRNSDEWVFGAAMWVLGGAPQLTAALRTAEANFNDGSAAALLTTHLQDGRRVRDEDRYVQTLAALWDVLPRDHAIDALDRYPPTPADDESLAAERRSLWAVLAVLVPDEWRVRYRSLPAELQRELVGNLGTGLILNLPPEVQRDLAVRCAERLQEGSALERDVPEGFWDAAAALWSTAGADDLRDDIAMWMARASPLRRLRIGTLVPKLRTRVNFTDALSTMMDVVRDEADAARQGRMSIPVVSPTTRLAQALSTSRRAPLTEEIVRDLVAIAADQTVLADFRANVMQGLSLVARSWKTGHSVFAPLRSAKIRARFSDFGGTSTELLDALRLSIVAVGDPRASDVAALLAASRSTDDRVRELAVTTSAERLMRKADPALAVIVGAGLHDSERSVFMAAIRAVDGFRRTPPLLRDIVEQRLPALYEAGDSDVRAAVCRAIQSMSERGAVPAKLEDILRSAAGDRSWKVRAVVVQPAQPRLGRS